MTIKWKHIISVSFVVFISLLSLFYQLGDAPISMWDEARYANNALQFFQHPNQILIVKYDNLPDLYNTKPPLVIWLQSLSMSVFGISEWSIRFPSAVFGLLSCVMLFHFSKLVFKSNFLSILSVLLLLGASGYVSRHVTRTGDLDSALSFFLFASFYFSYILINFPQKNQRHNLLALFLSLFLGFMTKGIAGFFFVPVTVLMVMFSEINKKDKIRVIAVVLMSILMSLSYYFIREQMSAGYFHKVISSEIMRIGSSTMSWQNQPFIYYLQLLYQHQYKFAFILMLAGAVSIAFKFKHHPLKWVLILAVFYLLLINISSNKLNWYTAPLFTLFSLISISFISLIYQYSLSRITSIYLIKTIQLSIIVIFLFPVYSVIEKNTVNEKEIYSMEREGAFIRKLMEEGNTFDTLYVVKRVDNDIHLDQLRFYEFKYKTENKLKSIQICQEIPEKIGCNILLSKEIIVNKEANKFELKRDWHYMQWLVKH